MRLWVRQIPVVPLSRCYLGGAQALGMFCDHLHLDTAVAPIPNSSGLFCFRGLGQSLLADRLTRNHIHARRLGKWRLLQHTALQSYVWPEPSARDRASLIRVAFQRVAFRRVARSRQAAVAPAVLWASRRSAWLVMCTRDSALLAGRGS